MSTPKQWSELSANALEAMKLLGDFGPTVHAANREVKGCMPTEEGDDGRCYLDSGDLRELAQGCTEVADWLDQRAALTATGGAA